MPAKLGAKLMLIKGERFLKGRVRCECCGKIFKLFWREDFILSRHFHCAKCDSYIAGMIDCAKEEAEDRPNERWPFAIFNFDLDGDSNGAD